jgi:hypothetical protein
MLFTEVEVDHCNNLNLCLEHSTLLIRPGNEPYNDTMNTQSFSVRRPAVPSGLSIKPPSPGQLPLLPPKIVTPTIPNQNRPHATSPTYSTRSLSTHVRGASIETTRSGDGPPVPNKGDKEKRLPLPPWVSPSKKGEKGSYAGAYDNKLVKSQWTLN